MKLATLSACALYLMLIAAVISRAATVEEALEQVNRRPPAERQLI